MATMRTKTVRYAFSTSIVDLATNTTLGTATRLDFTAITVTIPETTSRTFLSVQAVFSFRDRFTVANEISGVRTGSKVGAAAYVDVDRSFSQANTGDHLFDEWTLDCTDNFNTNFGAGTTQTIQCGLAIASLFASNIGGSITCELLITYKYDDSVGTTRVKTVMIPIQSHHTAISNAQLEIGTTGGTTNAPANQIPAFDTYLPEGTKTYKQIYIISQANDGSTAATDITPFIQIDAVAEVARGLIGQALITTMPWRDIFDLLGTGASTASAHAFQMRADVTARMTFAGAMIVATYTYVTSATTSIINQVMVPLTESDNDEFGLQVGEGFNTTDFQTLVGQFDIPEPGSITLKQSAVIGNINSTSTSTAVGIAAGGQATRTLTPVIAAGEEPFIHRGDHSSGWTIAHGPNRLTFKVANTASAAGRSSFLGYLFVSYTSGVPAAGCEAGNHVVNFYNTAYGTSAPVAIDIAASGGGQRAVDFGGLPYSMSGVLIVGRMRAGGGSMGPQLLLEQRAGEWDAAGWISSPKSFSTLAELSSWWWFAGFTRAFNKDTWHENIAKLNVRTSRRQVLWGSAGGIMGAWSTWITYHQVTFTVSGTVTVGGSPVADSANPCYVIAQASGGYSSEDQWVVAPDVAGGAGAFSTIMFDDWRTVFVVYNDGVNIGASNYNTAGHTFNIAMGSSSGETTPPIATGTAPTSKDYTIVKDQPFVVTVTDAASAVGLVSISVKFGSAQHEQQIYSGKGSVSGFMPGYQTRSTVSGSGAAGVGFTFQCFRDGSWPKGTPAVFTVRATDALGNVLL